PSSKGGIAGAVIEVSTDGKKFKKAGQWEFGNLINDPTERLYVLDKAVTGRYLRIVPQQTADGNAAVIAEIGIYPEK
ncbi:MAG: discoidin domain-containing protein, partial [Paramuribaculum sp.]|nr:discoidin domain-containing protein [Paramuribaculum sp.]